MLTQKTLTMWSIIIVVIVASVGLIYAGYSIYNTLNTPLFREPELSDLRNVWGIEIPFEATEINFESDMVERGYIGLSFNIPSDNLESFVASICDGMLHEGYNPFDAINSEVPLNNAILIRMNRFTYYSYSPDAPTTIFGNRCNATPGELGQVHQIAVDKTDPELFSVRFEQPGRDSTVPRSNSMGINYVNPIRDFPLMIVGLQDVDGEYQIIHNELCIDTLQVYADVSAWRSEWENFKGANVQIEIDSMSFTEGTISPQGRLIPTELLATENALIQNNAYWQYCINQVWESGTHQIKISISGSNMNAIEEVIEFTSDNLE